MRLLTLSDFAPARGETLDLALGEATVAMTLAEVRPLANPPLPGALRDPFELVFRSASPVILPQRAYTFKSATLGSLDIFIVPVGRDSNGIVYQAIFN